MRYLLPDVQHCRHSREQDGRNGVVRLRLVSIKLSAGDSRQNEGRQGSEDQRDDSARWEEPERAPRGISQADYEPPRECSDSCSLGAESVNRPDGGLKPQNGNGFQQINDNIE